MHTCRVLDSTIMYHIIQFTSHSTISGAQNHFNGIFFFLENGFRMMIKFEKKNFEKKNKGCVTENVHF